MAYTRPASSSADLAWTGRPAYTRPSATSADFSFVESSTYPVTSLGVITKFGTPLAIWDQFGSVSGFAPVQFGTPTHRRTQPVSGFAPVQFGTPTGYKLQRVQGFAPVRFGTPFLHPSHVAPWPVSTQFGTPSARQYWKVPSLGVITKFGTPTTPTNRTCDVSGFAPVRFGAPVSFRTLPPDLAQSERAFGFRMTAFGAPVARWALSEQASALGPVAQFGTPRASGVHHAVGVAPVAQFGTPLVQIKQRASGFSPVHTGAPGSTQSQRATGAGPQTRFGLPRALRSNWHEAPGFATTRFGHPVAYQRNNHHATGLLSTQFGVAASRLSHRASALAPVTRFGTPLLKRITQC